MSQTETPKRKRQFHIKPATVLNIALVLVVAIGLAIYYRPPKPLVPSIDRHSAAVTQAASAPSVLPLRSDDLDGFTFTRDDVAFQAERIDGVWYIVDPFVDRADARIFTQFVDAVAGIAIDEEIAEPEAIEAYGLDAPIISAFFVDRNGNEASLAIGHPEGSVEWFIQTSDDIIYLVRNLPSRLFSVIPGELIAGQLLDFNPADVRRITSIAGDETKVIEAAGSSWFSQTPEGRALVFGVADFLRDLHFLNASSIAATAEEEPWERLGLTPAGQTMHIELLLADGSTRTLDVGGTTADGRRYYVRSSDRPHAYIVVEFSANNLATKLAQATTDVLSVNLARVQDLVVTTVGADNRPVERAYRRDANEKHIWTSERRVAFNVFQLLESVNGVTAFQVAPEAPEATYGFHPHPGSLRLRLTMENRAVNILEIGAATSDGQYVYVRSNTRPGIYLASPDAVAAIREGMASIRTDLLPFDAANVNRLEFANVPSSGEPVIHELVRSNGTWTRAGETVTTADVDRLLTQLRGLQAERIPPVVSEEEYEFFPAAQSTRVTITLANGDEYILDIGAAKQEGTGWFALTNYYVRVSGLSDVVFISERNTRDIRTSIDRVSR